MAGAEPVIDAAAMVAANVTDAVAEAMVRAASEQDAATAAVVAGSGFVSELAASLGFSEPSLRITLSLIMGTPLALLFNLLFSRAPAAAQHVFFASSGMMLIMFCFGNDVIHSLVTVLVTYLMIRIAARLGRYEAGVAAVFIFNLGYLVAGYIRIATAEYTIDWTIPHCVLCLRMIGLAFDVMDGQVPVEKRMSDRKETGLKDPPALLPMLGFAYSFFGVMVGPQYSFDRYDRFVRGELFDRSKEYRGRFYEASKRFFGGLLFAALYPLITTTFTMTIYEGSNPAFLNWSFTEKISYMVVTTHFYFFKFFAVYLLAETPSVVAGIGFNGVDPAMPGYAKWNALYNLRLIQFELACTIDGVIQSMNINTSLWAKKYIFKRLMFLGNRNLSNIITMAFLAVWHGIYIGYFFAWAIQFLVVQGRFGHLGSKSVVFRVLGYIIGYTYRHLTIGYALISFHVLYFADFWPIWVSLHHFMPIGCVAFLVLNAVIPRGSRPSKPKGKAE